MPRGTIQTGGEYHWRLTRGAEGIEENPSPMVVANARKQRAILFRLLQCVHT